MKNGPLLGDLFKMGKVIYQVHLQRNSTVPKDFTLDAALIHRLLQAAPNPTKEDYPTVESDIPFELVQPDLKAPVPKEII